MNNTFRLFCCVIVAALFSIRLFAGPDVTNTPQQKAPLSFIENKGQVRDQYRNARQDIQFQLKAAGGLSIFIGDGAIHYQFSKADKKIKKPSKEDMMKLGFVPEQTTFTMDRLDVELVGANKNAQVITEQKQDYYENYFTDWSGEKGTTVSAYNKITYKNIYPNIDWVIYTKNGQLEHEFVVHQGGKVSDIQLKYGGAKDLKINANGSLTAGTPQGTITEKAPDTYQKDGKKVTSAFKLNGNVLGYYTGDYSGELVIDPTLSWGTYFGGSQDETGAGTAADGSGNAYVTGSTTSTSGIATSGAFQTTYGGSVDDAYLAKFNSSGVIQWATYYGGNQDDEAFGVATDPSGNVYMTGFTGSSTGIATSGSYQSSWTAGSDAFLVKFNSAGARQWGTYYGGGFTDYAWGVGTDNSGNVFIVGETNSLSGIASPGSYQTLLNTMGSGSGSDGFLVKFNSAGVRQWATYFGGFSDDFANGVAADGSGNVYIAGNTSSNSGVASSGAYQTTEGSTNDAFLAKFNSGGTIQWSTYYGGPADDFGAAVTADASGNVYLCGTTKSPSAIASPGAYQTLFSGGQEAYLAKFNTSGSRLWATYYGGGSESGAGVLTDAGKNVFICGATSSGSGVATSGAYQLTFGGVQDAYLSEFDSTGAIKYATYYGGPGSDVGSSIATDGSGNFFISGKTTSTAGIATSGAYQTTYAGAGSLSEGDAFLVKFSFTCTYPFVAPVTGPTTVCPSNTITLADATSGGTWSSSNNSIATVGTSGVVTGVAAGNVIISYSVSNSCGTTNSLALITVGSEIITTIAGNGTAGYTGNGGPATGAEINLPAGVTQDGSGNTYIADWNNNVIRKINTAGIITTFAGTGATGYTGDGGPATSATFHNPVALIFNSAGELIIADYNNNVVRKISTSGIITTIAGNGIGGFSSDGIPATSSELHSPEGLALDAAGNLYIADGNNSRVRQVDVSGIIHTYAGTGGYTFGGDGGPATAAQMMNPFGLYMDQSGNLYICDQLSNRIRVVNSSGVISTVAGSGAFGGGTGTYSGDGAAATAATMNDPTGVYCDQAGNIYIADRGNSRVRFVNKSTGLISTIAGTGTAGFSGDGGSATAAKLNADAFIYLDANANIYISDYNNNRIRKIAPVGTSIQASSATICQGVPVLFTDSTSGGTWTSSNPAVAYVGTAIGEVTGISAGTATISYAVNFSCGLTYVLQPVTVNSFSAGTLSGPSIVCPGNTITLTDATGGGTWSSSNPAAATVSGGVVTGVAAGNTTISYTITNGCGTLAARQQVIVGVPQISTFAGTGTAGSTGDGGQATAATFNATHSIWSDASGNTYIADVNNHKIRIVNPAGIVSTFAGTGVAGSSGDGFPATNATIQSIFSIVTDATGNLYFADNVSNRVRMINTSGIISTIAGTGTAGSLGDGGPATAAQLSGPGGLSFDQVGNLFIGDGNNNKVRKISPSGIITTYAGTGVLGSSGDGSLAILATLSHPNYLHCDGSGNLYVADNGNSKIRKIDAFGVITTVAGTGTSGALGDGGPATAAQLSFPGGVALDGAGNIYIAGDGNQKIRIVYASSGIINTYAGTGTAGYSGDGGAPATAKLNTPVDVYFDNNGNLFIADNANNAIRKIAPVNASVTALAGPNTVCQGSTITLTDITSGGTWSSSAPAIATVGTSGIVTGVTAGVANISYSVVFSCGTISVSQSVTVNALPAVPGPITGPTNVCAGASVTLNDATAGGNWTSTIPVVATIGSTSGSLTGLTAGVTVVSYTISTSCGSNSVFRNDTVFSAPGAITGVLAACVGLTSPLGNSVAGGTWTSSNPAVASVGSSSGIVTGVTPGTVTITYNTGGACSSTASFTVNANPAAITPPGAVTMCVGATASLGDVTAGGTWSSAVPATATVGTSGIVTGVAAGTVNILYTTAAGCSATKSVTVLPTPTALAPTSATVCTGNTVAFTETIGGGIWSSTNGAVASVSAGLVTGLTAGTVNISYTIGTCAVGAPVTVNLSPAAGVITGPAILCTGTPVTYTDASPGGVWSSSNPAIATVSVTGLVTGITPGVFTLSYAVTNTCGTATATKVITVSPSPGAGTIIGTTLVCAGAFTTLVDTTSGGTWSASNTNATISGTGILVGVIPGIDTISYTVANTCGSASTTKIVTIGLTLTAGSISGPSVVCAGSSIALSETITGGTWSSSNSSATVSVAGLLTGVTGGTDTINYTVTSGCGSVVATHVVTVNPIPVSGSITGPTLLCAGNSATYTDPASGGVWSVTNANATISGVGLLNAISAGNDTVQYTVSNSCGTSVATAYVTIGPAISAGSISGPASVCVGFTITLTDASPGGVWSSSNTTADVLGGMVTGLIPGIDTISYTVTSTCGSVSTSAVVTVNPSTIASPITGPSGLCMGTTATYTDATIGGTWSLTNGNAIVTGGGLVTPVSIGADTLKYTVTGTCGTSVASQVINISLMPVAGTISGTSNICVGSTSTLTDAIPGGTWSASNGNATISSGVVTAVSPGLDTISYTVTSSCGSAVATYVIDINTTPSPGVITGPTSVCIGTLITLADTAIGGAWSASNPDATISLSGVVTSIAPGTDTISYTVTNACGSFGTSHIITISTTATAGSITGPSIVCAGASITLTDAVSGGIWASSNGNATVSTGGVVTGVTPGADTITYVVTNACGSATASYAITVGAALTAGTISGSSAVCVGSTITLTDPATGGIWSSSSTNATVSGGIVTGVAAGTATISYTVTGSCGTITATHALTINVAPAAGTISGPTGVCAGAVITLSDAATGGVWSASNSRATVSGGTVTGVIAGLDTIRYSVSNGCGTAIASWPISVNSAPSAGTIGGAASVCPAASVTLTHTATGGTWSSSNTGIATVSGAGTVTGVASGAVTISYTLTNSCGSGRATHAMTVLSPASCTGLVVSGPGSGQGEELVVAPNPNKGIFTMNLDSDLNEEVQVTITNVIGQKVKEFTTTTNKVTDIQMGEAAGIYLLNATTSTGIHVAKVIIN